MPTARMKRGVLRWRGVVKSNGKIVSSKWFKKGGKREAESDSLGRGGKEAARNVMGKLCKKAGVRKFGFHAIRHLTAVLLYKEGKPVSMIQKILRHQHPTTTERYLASLGFELNEMKEALQVLSNRGPEKGRVIPFVPKEKTSQAGT